MLTIAKAWSIPFDKLAPYLINGLGKSFVKQNVKREDIVESYGKDALEIWKTLLEED